jgi:hypothetical protein
LKKEFFVKNLIKILALILCALFICTAAAACNDTAGEEERGNTADIENTGEEEPDDGIPRDNVPALDFGGYAYRVLMGTSGDRDGVDVYTEEEIGEVLNDTLYRRNRNIQERFNVTFDVTSIDGFTLLSRITSYVQAGSDDYDMQMLMDRVAQDSAGKGFVY